MKPQHTVSEERRYTWTYRTSTGMLDAFSVTASYPSNEIVVSSEGRLRVCIRGDDEAQTLESMLSSARAWLTTQSSAPESLVDTVNALRTDLGLRNETTQQ